MRIAGKFTLALLLFGISSASAQKADTSLPTDRTAAEMVSFLLDVGTQIRWTAMDCTHFVHYLYEIAGLPYTYAPSRTLYKGVEEFRRVSKPQPGDLIVWQGHAGIVVDAEEHTFLSVLRTGVKSSVYDSHYWQHRGHPRFFRHVALARAPAVEIAKLEMPKRIVVPEDGPIVATGAKSQHTMPGEAAIMGWMPPVKTEHRRPAAPTQSHPQHPSTKPATGAVKDVVVGSF